MRYSYPQASYARLEAVPGGLAFVSTYNAALVNAFKAMIPAESRRWDNASKRWLVDPRYGPLCAQLSEQYLNVQVIVPTASATTLLETRLLRIDYLGRCKDRGGAEPTAFGHCGGDWSVIIPESVLIDWFQAAPPAPDQRTTLYGVMGIAATSTSDELRSAYRRLARQWHPDLCREPNAAEVFKRIHAAYTVLGDPIKRKKYDAGLALEMSLQRQQSNDLTYLYRSDGYQPPLRCGYLAVEGQESLGRSNVTKILQWEDIEDDQGRVAVASWPRDAQTYVVDWV